MGNAVKKAVLAGILAGALVSAGTAADEEIKSYYEQQKAIFQWAFKAPAIGSDIVVVLENGEEHRGILKKLSDKGVQILSGEELLTCRRKELSDETRMLLFAADYAHFKALESARSYDKLSDETKAQLSGVPGRVYPGKLSVSVKKDKDADRSEDGSLSTSGYRSEERKAWSEVQHLTVSVSNSTSVPATYSLRWYFFSRDVGTDRLAIHCQGYEIIKLKGKQKVKKGVSSKKYTKHRSSTNTTTRYAGRNKTTADEREWGVEEEGYLVLLMSGDTVVDRKASAKRYLDPDWIGTLQ